MRHLYWSQEVFNPRCHYRVKAFMLWFNLKNRWNEEEKKLTRLDQRRKKNRKRVQQCDGHSKLRRVRKRSKGAKTKPRKRIKIVRRYRRQIHMIMMMRMINK